MKKHTVTPPYPNCPVCASATASQVDECIRELGEDRAAAIYRIPLASIHKHTCLCWPWRAHHGATVTHLHHAASDPAGAPRAPETATEQLERLQAETMATLADAADVRERCAVIREARANLEMLLKLRGEMVPQRDDGWGQMPLEEQISQVEAARAELLRRKAAGGGTIR